ncbi:hypothetical protein [Aristaeella hokkaidonensis]|uniref:Uncharacterized protein n=1 Tax=Aristaeella hokkaidonensis TaxID=3046382 RepID=A0AC61MYD8_9FIRM|nr:hypothetical protein [Aristaeella hokkaidonensis]QUC68032.1 hypothetical protein JYE49_04865 [Aristaeella hokkaidonensis]
MQENKNEEKDNDFLQVPFQENISPFPHLHDEYYIDKFSMFQEGILPEVICLPK